MLITRAHRMAIALMLYSCVLFSTFACALGHGQSSGLWLSGVGELTCSVSEGGSPQAPALPTTGISFDCPICSSGGLAPVAADSWTLDLPQWLPAARPAIHLHPLQQPPAHWPATEPRAPPANA